MEHTLIRLQVNDKEILLVPTAHVSKESAEYVRKVIDEEQPDCICIELDEDRYQSVTSKKKWEDTSLVDVIRQKKVGYLLVNLILGHYQKKLARQLDNRSGQEMIEGIEGSKRLQIPLVNADRSIQTTFSRVWRKQNFFDKIKLLSTIISTLFDDEEVSEEDLLNLQKEDMLTAALQEVQKEFPSIAEVLVHERDQVLAYNIRTAPGKKVLAILGAAHCIGIKEEIYKEYEIESLLDPGKKSPLGKILMWAIPVLLILMVVLTMQKNAATGMNQITGWILYNGVLSALGCLLCGAHPLTILISFVAAPITSLSPLLAAGWFAGMAEAIIRKPQVKDFESMDEDLNSFKGVFRNKIMKVLLIVVFANLGSTLGTFLGGMDIISKFLDVFTK